ncbi:hypothetical protein AeRB84_013244 [Aphanomyces euteiches]|nr:hypothetical protein AeRB84_013244 [Aphanomyces euteiches]
MDRNGKKSRASKAVHSLPPVDIIIKIAFCIPDTADLFAFLEALRPYNLLGPLDHLYQLGMRLERSFYLWPCLRLPPSLHEWSQSYEAIAKYYSKVIIYDFKWLKHHLNPTVKIEWVVKSFPAPWEIPKDTWELRITQAVHFGFLMDDFSYSKLVLSRLKHLESLIFYDDHNQESPNGSGQYEDNDSLWDSVFQFAAESHQLTQLQVARHSHTMTEATLINLTEWFRSQPVRLFDCKGGTWHQVDNDIKQTFYKAMFNCPTLDKLTLANCNLDDVDVSKLTFSIRSLELEECNFRSAFISSMASRLEGSRITHLELDIPRHNVSVDSMECLLQVIPRTKIKHLALINLPFASKELCKLALLFENCTVETLSLHTLYFTASFAQSLATAIQNNRTIRELEMMRSGLGIPNLRLLIQSICHSSRLVKRKRLRLTTSCAMWESDVKLLDDFAKECGGEFKYNMC